MSRVGRVGGTHPVAQSLSWFPLILVLGFFVGGRIYRMRS
jgi:hypothetical protein